MRSLWEGVGGSRGEQWHGGSGTATFGEILDVEPLRGLFLLPDPRPPDPVPGQRAVITFKTLENIDMGSLTYSVFEDPGQGVGVERPARRAEGEAAVPGGGSRTAGPSRPVCPGWGWGARSFRALSGRGFRGSRFAR